MEDDVKAVQLHVVAMIAKGKHPASYFDWGYLRPIRASRKSTGTAYLRKRWKCKCVCGNYVTVPLFYMMRPTNPKFHCGCKSGSIMSENKYTWNSWYMMHERVCNPNHKDHHHYGGRGITICDRWNKFVLDDSKKAFANFLEDMGPRPEGLTLDRIDNDGNYEPSNCRWATAKEQRANQRDM